MTRVHRCFAVLITLFSIVLCVGGCGVPVDIPDTAEKEPNDGFDDAQVITQGNGVSVEIEGTLTGGDDIDVYDIGSLGSGKLVSISWTTEQCERLEDVIIAMFDEEGEVARYEEVVACSRFASGVFSLEILEGGQYFVALAFVDAGGGVQLDYSVRVIVEDLADTYEPVGQLVYFNFHGADNVTVAGQRWDELLPFSDKFGGSRGRSIASGIVDVVEADYLGLDVQLVSSYEQAEPSATHTTVHITASTEDFLGLGNSVDWYNADPSDAAIIFAGAFDYLWTDAEFVQGLGNVASHELGHILGLVHTEDDTELMDRVTPARSLRRDQEFRTAEVSDFPIGYQDALELLGFILGLNLLG